MTGKLLFSLYITGHENNNKTMLICNPNAGYYEFIYFQSDWLEFYLSRGIHVFLWNYRGFGNSTGYPSIENIISDGKLIIEYLKHTNNANYLGIHGESLGGCIAIQLAEACGCDFLFVDRSFGYLSDTIFFNLGLIAYWCFKISRVADIESITTFLKLDCYKIISSDPLDTLIKDLASLKSGIATRIIFNSPESVSKLYLSGKIRSFEHIITNEECKTFCKSLIALNENWKIYCKEELDLDKFHRIINTDINEDNNYNEIKSILNKIMNILNGINAGGMTLKSVIAQGYINIQFYVWIMVLEVWGSYGDNILHKNIEDIQLSVLQLKNLENNSISNDIENIAHVLKKVFECLRDKITKQSICTIRSEADTPESELRKIGFLLPVTCGHNGQFDYEEKNSYEKHLENARFMSNNTN